VKIPAPLQALVDTGRIDTLGLLKLMKPGQLLQARVAQATTAGIAKLLVGNTTLTAKTRVPLQQGEALSLRVQKGLPEPQLKILRPQTQPAAQLVLRSAMRRQLPPQDVQQAIRQLPSSPAVRTAAPQQILRVLVPPAPPPQQVSAQTVQKAFQQSGLFFEPNLARDKLNTQDQKVQLLQLLRLFTPKARAAQQAQSGEAAQQDGKPINGDQLMNRLLRLVEASLGRIQSHQASSLPGDEPGRQVWQFEMPIQLVDKQDHLQLRVRREETAGEDGEDPQRVWKVDIEFDFDTLGGIFSRINLSGEQVSAAFWSQQDSTAAIIERAIPKLQQALLDAGLQVAAVSSLTGTPPRPAPPSDSLLDERA